VYLPGNHDELFRRFVGLSLANIEIENKAILELDGKKAWFFHGDVFDITMQHSRWLAKIGSVGYDSLIWLNYRVNQFLSLIGKEKKSFSKSIKNGVKSAVKYINKFEDLCADLAIEHGYHFVVCGHIHQPIIREVKNGKGSVSYLNSGDWVENLSALEYNKKKWEIINFSELNFDKLVEPADFLMDSKQEELFSKILQEFKMVESE
jgi:UDP-2,3-diacylglucosamine pyrophosphatase LpxH